MTRAISLDFRLVSCHLLSLGQVCYLLKVQYFKIKKSKPDPAHRRIAVGTVLVMIIGGWPVGQGVYRPFPLLVDSEFCSSAEPRPARQALPGFLQQLCPRHLGSTAPKVCDLFRRALVLTFTAWESSVCSLCPTQATGRPLCSPGSHGPGSVLCSVAGSLIRLRFHERNLFVLFPLQP